MRTAEHFFYIKPDNLPPDYIPQVRTIKKNQSWTIVKTSKTDFVQ